MKRSTRRWLLKVAREGYADAHPVNAADALDSDSRQRAEIRELRVALEAMVEANPCRNGCPHGDMTCATARARVALRPAKATR